MIQILKYYETILIFYAEYKNIFDHLLMKILYIRLDSSQLPESSDEIIIKDFNLEGYFCTLLGKRLLEDTGLSCAMPYPGKLITDFEKIDKEVYREIIQQWEKVLAVLLKFQLEDDEVFIFRLPDSYLNWLSICDIPNTPKIRNYYNRIANVSIKKRNLIEIVDEVLKKKLASFLQRNENNVNHMVFSLDEIDRESYIIKQWKQIILHDYKIWTLKDYKEWVTAKKWGITAFFPIHGIMLGETIMSNINSNCIKTRISYMFERDNFSFQELNYCVITYGNSYGFFMDWDKDNIIDRYGLYNGGDFPFLWTKYGFNWNLSYFQWLELLHSLSFTVIVEEEPQIVRYKRGWYVGMSFNDLEERTVLRAVIKAHSKDKSLSLILKFDYGNRQGCGSSMNAKDSLYLIVASRYDMNSLYRCFEKLNQENLLLKIL